jgi:signal transduction histidine kinase
MKNNKDIRELKEENDFLKRKIETLINEALHREQTLNNLIKESVKKELLAREITQNAVLREKELQTEVQTWQKFVDEIAHSINTDVYIAVSNLDKHRDLPKINKAFYHVKQIRDLTNLIMWYIKRDELKLSGELTEINVNKIISQQISDIKEGISTLRISSDEHQDNIIKSDIPIRADKEYNILINKEISDSISLVIKDLLRNAVKNSDEENPQVSVEIKSNDDKIVIEVKNNKASPREFSKWFNDQSKEEPNQISKSFKVGLRIIKVWIELLNIDVKLIPDYENNLTLTRIIFPKEIKYAAN